MNNAMYLLGLVFAVYTIFSIFYNYAARPMFSDRGRFRIFELRDKLRRLAIDGHVSASSFEYKYLESLLCRLVEKCAWLSWSSLLEFIWRRKDAELSPDTIRFEREASDAVKGIYFTAITEMMRVMCINSPISTLVFGVVAVSGRAWLDIKAKIFLEEPLSETAVLAT